MQNRCNVISYRDFNRRRRRVSVVFPPTVLLVNAVGEKVGSLHLAFLLSVPQQVLGNACSEEPEEWGWGWGCGWDGGLEPRCDEGGVSIGFSVPGLPTVELLTCARL